MRLITAAAVFPGSSFASVPAEALSLTFLACKIRVIILATS